MLTYRPFQVSLFVSILLHSVFFLSLPHIQFSPAKKDTTQMKVTYYKIKERKAIKRTIRSKVEPIVKKLPEIKKEEILKPPKVSAEKLEKTQKKVRQAADFKKVPEKKFEKVVEEERDEAKKATYIGYYRAIREKIKLFADGNYSKNRRLGEGEIFLSFSVASSGELLQVKVVDEKSFGSQALRNIAINSIRDATPFPPFPKGMREYRITFNVIIAFELNR